MLTAKNIHAMVSLMVSWLFFPVVSGTLLLLSLCAPIATGVTTTKSLAEPGLMDNCFITSGLEATGTRVWQSLDSMKAVIHAYMIPKYELQALL